jgi:colicin import membrane protein
MTDIVEKNALLVPFDPIEADIAKYKDENSKLVFDYEDAKGNKDARSHIFKLRQIKSSIAKIHQEVKSDVLKVSRAVIEDRIAAAEAEKQRLIQEEAARQEAVRLEAIRQQEEANRKRQSELDHQAFLLNQRQAELDRQEREKQIAEQAEQKAKDEAERKIREAEEKHQRELQAAENKRIADLKDAEEKAARELAAKEAEEKRLADIEAKRQANVKHRQKVEKSVTEILINHGMDGQGAGNLVEALSLDSFPQLKIIY